MPLVRYALAENENVLATPLSGLLNQIMMGIGLPSGRQVTRRQLEAILAAVGESEPDETLARCSHFPGFHQLLASTMHDLRHFGYASDVLASIEDPAVADRARALAGVMQRVDAMLATAHREHGSDRVARILASEPRPLPFLGDIVFVCGSGYDPQSCDLARWLAACGVPVQVIVQKLNHDELFGEAQRTLQHVAPGGSVASEAHWAEGLFTGATAADRDLPHPEVSIFSAADALAESEWALRHCLELTDQGLLPNRIAIIARDAATYAPLLRAASLTIGVPVNVRMLIPLLTNAFAHFVLELLRALASLDVRPLHAVLMNSYVGLDRQVSNELRVGLAECMTMAPDPWAQLDQWVAERSDRYTFLSSVLAWRKQALESEKSVHAWRKMLLDLTQIEPLPTTVGSEENATFERDLPATKAMDRALEDIAIALDQPEPKLLTLRGFASLAGDVWSREEMVLPSRIGHGVLVVSDPDLVIDCDVAFVLGMLEGVTPRRRLENAILDDHERAALSVARPELPRLMDSHDRARAERDFFVKCCTAPARKLVLSYPQTGEERDNVPAFYLTELERFFGSHLTKHDYRRSDLTPPLAACRSPHDGALAEALLKWEGSAAAVRLAALETDEGRDAIAADFSAGLDVDEILAHRQCSFRGVFQYRLRLRPDDFSPATLLPWLIRRARLGEATSIDDGRRRLKEATELFLSQRGARMSELEQNLFRASLDRVSSQLLHRELFSRDSWRQGTPIQESVSLSDPELRDEVPTPEGPIRLKGQIDGLWERDDHRVIRFYRNRSISLNKDDSFEVLFEYGLYILTAYRKGVRSYGLEIDALGESRTLYLLPRYSDIMWPKDAKRRAMVNDIDVEKDTFLRDVKAELRKVRATIASRTITPKPGRHCSYCAFGEVCRFSNDFGYRMLPMPPPDEEDVFEP